MPRRRSGGFYERRVFPWINDKLTGAPEIARLRAEALSPARGHVLEIGFGSGMNLNHYPPGIVSIVAVEPNDGMYDRSGPRLRASSIRVHRLLGLAEQLPLGDGTVDTAVSTLTLCSVSNPSAALAELRRVLRDDGQVIVFEHGLSDDPGVARWQHRLNGLENVIACGCNLNRPVVHMVEGMGFRFVSLRKFYMDGAPRTHGWVTVGAAVKA